ncbi:ATP-binding protein [Thermomonas carbonis]|uniref:ATP-binding protein n=1 Tax=Thermomonas carbonis TaxID=1463158 RepID=A0A7G9SNX2_9GAMM|nr:ATP-binding protein [Thermomonas carbonis]
MKRIVERHGGEIQAEGRPGHGASFRFKLGEALISATDPD